MDKAMCSLPLNNCTNLIKHIMANKSKEVKKENSKLHIGSVSGTADKDCKNCKYHNDKKNGCDHPNWSSCVVRDKDGFVTDLTQHNYR